MAENVMPRPASAFGSRLNAVTLVRSGTFIGLLGLYEAVARSGLLYEGVVPPIGKVVAAIWELLATPVFYVHFATTGIEAGVGFLVGCLFGAGLALIFAYFRFLGDALYTWFLWLAPTPKIIFVPILFLLFGIGMGSKIAMAALSAFFPIFIATFAGARHIRPVFLRVMESLNATSWQVIRCVYLPALLHPIVGAMRLSLGLAIIGSLLAEIKAAKAGLGTLLMENYNAFRIPEMYAILIIIFSVAIILNFAMDRFAERFTRPA